MTKNELQAALSIAMSDVELPNDQHDISVFNGFGLRGFQPVVVTVQQVAALIRWQCVCFNGGIDTEALQEIALAGRSKFQVLMVAPAAAA